MSITAASARPIAAAAACAIEAFDAAWPQKRSVSGFRMAEAATAHARTNPDAGRAVLRPTADRGDVLPLAIGFEGAAPPSTREGLLPADAEAMPMDGTWRWLGMLSCWLSTALVASLLILAMH